MNYLLSSFRALVFFTVLTGAAYPLVVSLLGHAAFSEKNRGSLLKGESVIVGSELLGQNFTSEKYFLPRPSAVKYDPASSGGTNLSVTAKELLTVVSDRRKSGFSDVMLTSSGSGLDPHISPKAAFDQIRRVARTRKMAEAEVEGLVHQYEEPRQFGFLGEPRVNVLKLNLALDRMSQR